MVISPFCLSQTNAYRLEARLDTVWVVRACWAHRPMLVEGDGVGQAAIWRITFSTSLSMASAGIPDLANRARSEASISVAEPILNSENS
jgi:hypothetical protein